MSPKRIQRSRAKGWRMPEGAVYVGRPTKWGNPFVVSERTTCKSCGQEIDGAYSPEQAMVAFRHYLKHPHNLHGWPMPTVEMIRAELRGKDLACWCRLDQPCHADVLLDIANSVDTPAIKATWGSAEMAELIQYHEEP